MAPHKSLPACLAACLLAFAAAPAPAQQSQALTADQAILALEEAELRERLVTALAVAESIRLRGRTILVAMSEIGRVRRRVQRIDPASERRAEFEARLRRLEERRIELDAEVDEEFRTYLVLVSEIAGSLWTRVDRVGQGLSESLAERRLSRLHELYPVVRSHVQEFASAETVTRAATDRWRREIDDTYDMRQERLSRARRAEPDVTNQDDSEEDI